VVDLVGDLGSHFREAPSPRREPAE